MEILKRVLSVLSIMENQAKCVVTTDVHIDPLNKETFAVLECHIVQ